MEMDIILYGVGTGFALYFILSLLGYAFREMISFFKIK